MAKSALERAQNLLTDLRDIQHRLLVLEQKIEDAFSEPFPESHPFDNLTPEELDRLEAQELAHRAEMAFGAVSPFFPETGCGRAA